MRTMGFYLKRYISILMAVMVLIISRTVPAADILTLEEAIGLALVNNTVLQAAGERVRESSLRVRETWGQLWPALSTDVSGTRMWAEKGIASKEYASNNIDFVRGTIAVNPGIFFNSLKSAREKHIATVNSERKTRAETTMATIRFYYRLLLADEIIKLRSDSLKALEENLKGITAGYKVGVYTRLDFLRAKVSTANENTRLILAENESRITRAELNIQMGRDIDSAIVTDSKRAETVSGEAEKYASWSEKARRKKFDSMVLIALKNRPELLEIRAKKNADLASAHASQSIYLWPTFFISGNYGTSRLYSRPSGKTGDAQIDRILGILSESFVPPGWNRNWNITVGATYRWGALSPLDSSHAKSDAAKSRVRQSELQLKGFIRSTRLEIKKGILNLYAASNAIISQKENIKSAEESLRVAIVQFKNGIIDNTKLLEANVELASAKSLYYRSLYDLQTAKAGLNRSMGAEFFKFREKKGSK